MKTFDAPHPDSGELPTALNLTDVRATAVNGVHMTIPSIRVPLGKIHGWWVAHNVEAQALPSPDAPQRGGSYGVGVGFAAPFEF